MQLRCDLCWLLSKWNIVISNSHTLALFPLLAYMLLLSLDGFREPVCITDNLSRGYDRAKDQKFKEFSGNTDDGKHLHLVDTAQKINSSVREIHDLYA